MWSLNGEFAYQFLKQSIAGATSPHLNIFDIRNVPVFLPPVGEQDQIIIQIEQRANKHRALSAAISASIDGLRELHSSLITAAVSGQIDVPCESIT
jgi:restriction endonuclease S subunit